MALMPATAVPGQQVHTRPHLEYHKTPCATAKQPFSTSCALWLRETPPTWHERAPSARCGGRSASAMPYGASLCSLCTSRAWNQGDTPIQERQGMVVLPHVLWLSGSVGAVRTRGSSSAFGATVVCACVGGALPLPCANLPVSVVAPHPTCPYLLHLLLLPQLRGAAGPLARRARAPQRRTASPCPRGVRMLRPRLTAAGGPGPAVPASDLHTNGASRRQRRAGSLLGRGLRLAPCIVRGLQPSSYSSSRAQWEQFGVSRGANGPRAAHSTAACRGTRRW